MKYMKNLKILNKKCKYFGKTLTLLGKKKLGNFWKILTKLGHSE